MIADGDPGGDVPADVRGRLHGGRRVARARLSRRATCSPGTPTRRTCACRRTSTGCRPSRNRSRTSPARAASSCSATASRPTTFLPAGAIKPDSPAGGVPARARRRAQGLQLLRVTARQPRGDGARDVRQRPPPEPARARVRGNVDGAPAGRRGDDDLRRVPALPRGRGAADRDRRQGVRVRVVSRLGGEGAEPARRASGDRGVATSGSTARTC